MVACTLDYDWSRYVIAALICLFGGVVVLLPWRLAWYAFERWRRRRRSSAVTRLRSTLGRLRSGAEDILAGSSTVNKIIVSMRLGLGRHRSKLFGPDPKATAEKVHPTALSASRTDHLRLVWPPFTKS